ncbi:MAG: TetR family transcriptional regulator C-terminal domain-containing protein [Propionibacteriaceae bacterium]|nr:TetR family transcriptional regulator C-terminal domain-containing protein [Propionibacteriaceae bacterium]
MITKIGEFIQEGKVTGPSQDPLPLISKMTEYIDENLDCFRMLLCGDDAELFAGKLKELFMENLNDENMIPADIRSSIEFCILMHYVAGGLVNVIQMLLRSDTGHPLSEYSKGLANLIRIPKRVGRTIIGELFGSITTTKNALHHTTS